MIVWSLFIPPSNFLVLRKNPLSISVVATSVNGRALLMVADAGVKSGTIVFGGFAYDVLSCFSQPVIGSYVGVDGSFAYMSSAGENGRKSLYDGDDGA